MIDRIPCTHAPADRHDRDKATRVTGRLATSDDSSSPRRIELIDDLFRGLTTWKMYAETSFSTIDRRSVIASTHKVSSIRNIISVRPRLSFIKSKPLITYKRT